MYEIIVMNFTALGIGLLISAASTAEPAFTVKYDRVAPSTNIAEPIRKLLGGDALVVRNDQAEVVMTIWFRTVIPVHATPEQLKNGLTYREIREGELVGVIQFPRVFTDFRRQDIPAGVYTLRFAIQPDIGDHAGTAPHPDFCLMSPVASDTVADLVEKKELIRRSSEVNEGKHPAVLLLFPHHAKDEATKLVDKGDGVWVVTTRRAVTTGEAAGTLGFAITVAGMRKS